jgi:hypothetical protein
VVRRASAFTLAVCVLGVACGSRTPLDCARDVPTTTTPPTLYFVIDRSASMALSGNWSAVRSALASLVTNLGARARVGMALFPDEAGDGCGPGTEVFAPRTHVSADDVYTALARDPQGGTPLDGTIQALTPRLTGSQDEQVAVVVVTDGGPNCNGQLTCDAARCTENIDATQGCPPNGPNCCDPNGIAGPEGCLDDQGSANAVAALLAKNVRTFVLGVPGSEPYAATLDTLAVAGGTARPTTPRYYRVGDADGPALGQALEEIVRASETGCELDLASFVDAPHTTVSVGGDPYPFDVNDGWTVTDQRLTLHGAACARRRSGGEVKVTFDDQCVH